MWRYSLPWHKVLNAVVAGLSIHKVEGLKRTHRFSVTLSFAPKRSLYRTGCRYYPDQLRQTKGVRERADNQF